MKPKFMTFQEIHHLGLQLFRAQFDQTAVTI